jgi:hypothetical protein
MHILTTNVYHLLKYSNIRECYMHPLSYHVICPKIIQIPYILG